MFIMGTRDMAAEKVVYTGYRGSLSQTLVNEELEQEQDIPDSDKENEEGLSLNAEIGTKKSDFIPHEQETEMKSELAVDKTGQAINVNVNHIKSVEKENLWADFLTGEEIQGKMEVKKEQLGEKTFESLEKETSEGKEAVSGTFVTGNDGYVDKKDGTKDKKLRTKRGTPKIKEARHLSAQTPTARHLSAQTPTRNGGSHPDLSSHDNDKSHIDVRLETMSETGGKHGRRLGRRQQVTRPKCAGPAPSGDVLQQKIQELHALMVKPLTEPKQYMHQTRQELLHLLGVSQQHAAQIMENQSLPSTFRRGPPQTVSAELTSDNSDDGYWALRAAQTGRATPSRPWTAVQARREKTLPSTDRQQRPFSASRHQDINLQAGNRHLSPGTTFTELHGRGRGDQRGSKESRTKSHSQNVRNKEEIHKSSLSENDNEEVQSSRGSPDRVIQHTDTHLNYTDNPALKKWLKKKNKEFRRHKAEERRRLKKEREKKEDAVRAKQELFKDSDIKVKEWVAQKRKEARKIAKEKRRIMKEEEMRHGRNQRQRIGVLRSKSLELSPRTQTPQNIKFIPVIRPETSQGETNDGKQQNSHGDVPCTETEDPHPPESKFVYKRPVSGRVRFMKLQQKQKADAKKSEHEKRLMEAKLAQDKAKTMRMSYDQWLLKKREEDHINKQEIAKQKSLAKSDPELERILPELAGRRIERIQEGKKRIDTGLNVINVEVNKSFGGSDFQTEPGGIVDSDETSNKLEVSGQQKALKLRPSTAKQPFSPKESKSPRRAMSAAYHIQPNKDTNTSGSSQPNPFRLPFPPQEGAPKYVISKQKKLFSSHVTQDKTSNVSDCPGQMSPDALKMSDPSAEESLRSTGPGSGHGSMNIQNVSSDVDDLKHAEGKCESAEEDKCESAEDVKSFFVTHGNLGDVSQAEAYEAFQEIENEDLEVVDESEELGEEIELDNQGIAEEPVDVLDNQGIADEPVDFFDNQRITEEPVDVRDNQEIPEESIDVLDNQEIAEELVDIFDNQENCEKVNESHHPGNAKDKIDEGDLKYDRLRDDSDDVEQNNVAEERIKDDTDDDNDIFEGNVTLDRKIDDSDDSVEKYVTRNRIIDDVDDIGESDEVEDIIKDDCNYTEENDVTCDREKDTGDDIEESNVTEDIFRGDSNDISEDNATEGRD